MILLAAILSIATFVIALKALGVIKAGADVLHVSRTAVSVMRDSTLDEEQREVEVQQAAVRLLVLFLSITVRSIMVAALSLLPIWIMSVLGATTVNDVVLFLSRWDVISVSTVALLVAYLGWNTLRMKG